MNNLKLEQDFLKQVNENIGIVYKVSAVYFLQRADRDDAVQEILYQLWKSFPSFNGDSRFSTWMYKVALNTAISLQRKTGKTRVLSFEANHEKTEEPAAFQNEQLELLYKTIHALRPVDRAIALLYLDDNTYEQIAQVTGLSKSNVSVRLVRLKRLLEQQFKQLNKHL